MRHTKRCVTDESERGAHGGKEQLGNRGRAHRGGPRRGRLPRLPGVGERPRTLAAPGPKRPAPPPPAGHAAEPKDKKHPLAVPADSGTGAAGRVRAGRPSGCGWSTRTARRPRTFAVMPSTVDPRPGTYKVTSRTGRVTGSDGVPIEHVVRFAVADGGVPVGFSAARGRLHAEPGPRSEDRRHPETPGGRRRDVGRSRRSAPRSSSSRRRPDGQPAARRRARSTRYAASPLLGRSAASRRVLPVSSRRRGGDRGGRGAGRQQILHRHRGRHWRLRRALSRSGVGMDASWGSGGRRG